MGLVPHDLEAEAHLLGAMMLSASAIADVVPIVVSADFFHQGHAALFALLVNEWSQGQKLDPFTAARSMEPGHLESLGGASGLMGMQSAVPSTSSAPRYAGIVASCATRKRVIAAAHEVMTMAEQSDDAGMVIDQANAAFAGIAAPIGRVPDDLWTVDEYCERPEDTHAAWVVPGLLRADWRVLVVAGEGVGKSYLTRQVAVAAAQGVHPLSAAPIPPVRTLLVDLENPSSVLVDSCNVLRRRARWSAQASYEEGRAWLWHRQGGIDLRTRAGRSDLESVLNHTRPDLVCIGPLYKSYQVSARERDEQAAGEVQDILDDLRMRYHFGLLMEHHAPKAQGGKRELDPYGSSFWMRWPEIGIKLVPLDPACRVLQMGRFRLDRVLNAWPDKIERSSPWPWVGHWDDPEQRRGAA